MYISEIYRELTKRLLDLFHESIYVCQMGLDTDKLVDLLTKFDPYLTAGDISLLMGRHTNTILSAMSKGEIPVSTGPGERPRVKLSTLMEWGNMHKNTFQPPPSIVPETIRRECNRCGASTCGRCGKAACQGCA
jgi:hypothetical protein